MGNPWFESVAEAQRRAEKRLPKSVHLALKAGSERGVTLQDNLDAFTELGFAPHVADLAAEHDLATSVMGQPVSMPVLISPTGVQAVHPDGEVAVARVAAADTAIGLSSFGSKPVEEVVAANPKTFFQTYWCGNVRPDPPAPRPSQACRLRRTHRYPRLVVLTLARLGQPLDSRTARPAHDAAVRPPGRAPSPSLARVLGEDRCATRSHRPQHGLTRRGRPRLSPPTASGCRHPRLHGTTSPGCANNGTGPSC